MQEREIVLVKLSATLAPDIKKFIGTILISELLHAVQQRQHIPVDQRHQFCIFVDEIQNFTSFEDFSTLINEARKFGIATTFAHQERYGQLSEDKKIQGATAAAANKIFFQTTVRDSQELAPEYAKPPPTETKLEREMVISQEPFSDLLRVGHKNPQIREFVNQRLRPLQERLEDTKEDMESERLIRMDLLDEAALFRTDERKEGIYGRYGDLSVRENALVRTERALIGVRGQTEELSRLHKRSEISRRAIRGFNKFFTAIMEGRVAEGQEEFSQVVKVWVSESSSPAPQNYEKLLGLYISLLCGDPKKPRTIPFAFAKANRFFADNVTAIQQEAEEKIRREKEEFLQERWETYHNEFRKGEAYRQKCRQENQEALLKEISASKLDLRDLAEQRAPFFVEDYCLPGEDLVLKYMLLHEYPSVAKIFEPYFTARFAPPWKGLFPDCTQTVSWMLDWVRFLRKRSVRGLEYFNYYNPAPWSLGALNKKFRSGPDRDSCPKGFTLIEIDLLDRFELFVKQYGEGAIVVLVLLMTFADPTEWRSRMDSPHYINKTYNTLYVPTLVNKDPLEIFLLFDRLVDILPHLNIRGDCQKYTWWCPHFFDFCEYGWMKGAPRERFTTWRDEGGFYTARCWTRILKEMEEREDMQCLSQYLAQSRDPLVCQYWWKNGEMSVRIYLKARACDIAMYGQNIADRTFPQPTVQGTPPARVAEMVAFMVQLLEEGERRKVNQRKQRWVAEQETRLQKEFDQRFRNKPMPLPANLAPRVLSYYEIEALKEACRNELIQSGDEWWNPNKTLALIDEFIKFCILLRKPENHIQVPSMQYVEKQVNSRTIKDMVDEMAQELTDLPPKIAYAKFIKEKGEERLVIKHKFKTFQPPKVLITGLTFRLMRAFIEDKTLDAGMVKERVQIEEEIRLRQEKWRSQTPESTRRIPPSEEPPPSFYQ
jgi:hypothetical protein